MLFMQDKAKEQGYDMKEPSEQDVSKIYSDIAKHVLKLSNNPRAEQFTWSTHLKNYAMHERNKKRGRSCF